MRDPLQPDSTPFDVLGVAPDACQADIVAAFKKVFAQATQKGTDIQRLLAARAILDRPAQRGLQRVLHYQPAFLGAVTPSPLVDPGSLHDHRRAATAAAWEAALSRGFPDTRIIHSLAVLWYWWALHGEGNGPSPAQGPPVDERWRKASIAWATLVATDAFWPAATGLDRAAAPEVADAVVRLIHSHFKALSVRHSAEGQGERAARFRELDLGFETELRAARAVAASEIGVKGGSLCSGPQMLDWVGLLEEVRRDVEKALRVSPTSRGLRAVRDNLSPLAQLYVLLEEGKPAEALAASASLDRHTRATEEARHLKARAQLELGRQRASLGNIDEAMAAWCEALDDKPPSEDREEVFDTMVAACLRRAGELSEAREDEAIALLEQASGMVDDTDITARLAELLMRRGISRVRAAQDAEEDGRPKAKVGQGFDSGIADLERAAGLGSRRADEQLRIARDLARQSRLGGQFAQLVTEFNEAAEREPPDWDTMVDRLRKALAITGDDAPADMHTSLGAAIANRALARANDAIGTLNASAARVPPTVAVIALTIRELERARVDLDEALRLAPGLSWVQEGRTQVERDLVELNKAVQVLDAPPARATVSAPPVPPAWRAAKQSRRAPAPQRAPTPPPRAPAPPPRAATRPPRPAPPPRAATPVPPPMPQAPPPVPRSEPPLELFPPLSGRTLAGFAAVMALIVCVIVLVVLGLGAAATVGGVFASIALVVYGVWYWLVK